LQHARASLGNWSLLFWASLAGLPVILPCALAMGEPFWPGTHGGHWWPLIVLAMGSQVVGQGLLVYALRHFSPIMIGMALLTQPAVAVAAGWAAFGETLTIWDGVGILWSAPRSCWPVLAKPAQPAPAIRPNRAESWYSLLRYSRTMPKDRLLRSMGAHGRYGRPDPDW
jgi:hypothetical protein